MFGQVSAGGLLALRWSVVIAFVLVWNALNLLALHFNGGWGRYEDPRSFVVLALATGATATLSFAIVLSARLRSVVTAPARRDRYEASPFVLIGCITGFLAIACVYELYAHHL